MSQAYCKQILDAKKFYDGFIELLKTKTYKEKILISEYDTTEDKIKFIIANFEMQNNPAYSLHLKVVELLKEFLIYKKKNLYALCKEIFPLIEIICYDKNDNIIVKQTEIADRTDIKLFNISKILEETMDLIQNKNASNDINFYYRDNSIQIFKFKFYDQTNESIQNDTFYINTYFHNIRTFLSVLVCQAYNLIMNIKEKCGKLITNDKIELYYGIIQSMNGKLLKDLIYDVNSDFYINYLNISIKKDNIYLKYLPYSDQEIINWIEFLSNSSFYLKKLNQSESIKNEFDKICLLYVSAYSKSYFSEDCNDEEININQNGYLFNGMISKLIGDCFDILKAENEFSKNMPDWSLLNFLKLFSNKHSVDHLIVSEIHNKTIDFIKEKVESILSQTKIKDIFCAAQKRKIRNEEISSLIEITKIDIHKLSMIIKFVIHMSWSDKVAMSIGEIYKELIVKKEKLDEFNKELSTY